MTSEDLVVLLSRAQSANDTSLALLVVVLAEDVAGTRNEDLFLGELLGAVPPFSDHVRENNTQENCVDEQDVFAGSLGDQPLGQGDADAEALLAVGVAVLDVVVADLFVGKSLECLGDVDPMVVDGLEGDVLGRVLTGFVGVQCERELSVVLLDRPLVGRLRFALDPSPQEIMAKTRTLETPSTSYGSQILVTVRAVTQIRYIMRAFSDQPPSMRSPRLVRLSARFCFLRWPWMRSACSGAKLDSIVVPVFSSSAYVSERLCGVGRLQAAMRTFARSEERDCCRYGDQCGDC